MTTEYDYYSIPLSIFNKVFHSGIPRMFVNKGEVSHEESRGGGYEFVTVQRGTPAGNLLRKIAAKYTTEAYD